MADIDWTPVHAFVAGLKLPTPLPLAGTAEWQAADDAVKTASLIVAGSRRCLEEQICDMRERRAAMKSAAVEISQAKDWAAIEREIRQRNEFQRANPWAKRVAS